MSDESLEEKKKKTRIKRIIESISIKTFIDDYIYRIDLDADYQREKIWSKKDQERLLDSIIKNIDIPKIYLAIPEEREIFHYECIDGKQRMLTLLNFFKPDSNEKNPLTVEIAGEGYTYGQLKKEFPKTAEKIENYVLTFVIYTRITDELIREIFRRLQLGVRLNSGELLKTRTGTIRDFIYREIGNDGPFFRRTNLSEKRFSRPFTLAQICINSFNRIRNGDFVRARLQDIEEFFEEYHNLERDDEKLARIKKVLEIMDKEFAEKAQIISSRAIAVSAYLFAEELYLNKKTALVPKFVEFLTKLINEIDNNMELLRNYKRPENTRVMEEFQKYILQASVEAYSIKRRHNFLKKAFEHYCAPKTKGIIIGSI